MKSEMTVKTRYKEEPTQAKVVNGKESSSQTPDSSSVILHGNFTGE